MDTSLNLIEQIAADKTQKKKIISLANKLTNRLSLNSKNDLENLKDLCYWLYIYGQKEKAELLCQIVDAISFESEHPNFDIWTWVQSITALHMRILREQNKPDKVEEYRPRVTVQYEGEAKLLRRILNGSLLYTEKIKAYESEGDEKSANTWRFLQVNKLCEMRELGGSETYPIEALDAEIERLKTILSAT